MYTREQIDSLDDGAFLQFFGVKKPVYALMLDILERAEKPIGSQGGRPRSLDTFGKLIVMLEYYHDYLPMRKLAFQWGVQCQSEVLIQVYCIKPLGVGWVGAQK